MQTYHHTQQSPLHFLLYMPAAFLFFAAWQIRESAPPSIAILLVGCIFVFISLSFQRLTIKDDQGALDIRYGPINVFGTRIRYTDIDEVQTGNTSLIDGWGIHFIPFRGWTINLWGFECVEIRRGEKTIRLGTDDSQNLQAFLHRKAELDRLESDQPKPEQVE